MTDNGVGVSGANSPIDPGVFQGAKETQEHDQQLGSDGRLKGTKVSKLKNIRKLLQHASKGRETYPEKRAAQVSLCDRRVKTLESLKSPKEVGAQLDKAGFDVRGHTFELKTAGNPLIHLMA